MEVAITGGIIELDNQTVDEVHHERLATQRFPDVKTQKSVNGASVTLRGLIG